MVGWWEGMPLGLLVEVKVEVGKELEFFVEGRKVLGAAGVFGESEW